MAFWDDDDDERQKRADESWARLKDRFGKFRENSERREQEDDEWYSEVDALLSDPTLIRTKSGDELEDLRLRAEIKIDELQGGLDRSDPKNSQAAANLRNQPKGAGWADVLTGLHGLLSIPVQNRIQKNRQLLKLISAKQNRDRAALPRPSRNEQIIAQRAEREHEREELITLLEKQRDEEKLKHPERAQSIDRRYRKLIEAVIEEE
jgi:hypothetical protein